MSVQNVKRGVSALSTIAAISLVMPALSAEPLLPPVDINRAIMAINFTPGITPADGLNVKCGLTSGGPYNRVTQLGIATTTVPVLKIIGGNGSWFCIVKDFVQTASGQLEGQGSNEINFFAVVAPSGTIEISIIP